MRRVLHMSALNALRTLRAKSVSAVITDPPAHPRVDLPEHDDVCDIDVMIAQARPLAEQVRRVLKPGGSSVFVGTARNLAAWEVSATRVGLVWVADFTILWLCALGALTSTVRWHVRPGLRRTEAERRTISSNVIVCKEVPMRYRRHAAQKPVELTNLFVSLLTREGELVADPFCGSGSTLVSAEMCGREWIGCDTDAEQVEIARERVTQMDMEVAELGKIHLWSGGKLEVVEG